MLAVTQELRLSPPLLLRKLLQYYSKILQHNCSWKITLNDCLLCSDHQTSMCPDCFCLHAVRKKNVSNMFGDFMRRPKVKNNKVTTRTAGRSYCKTLMALSHMV